MDTWEATPTEAAVPQLAELVYELLDAHQDTTDLARDRVADVRWAAHLDYLRRLQRIGREALARTDAAPAAPGSAPAPGSARRRH
jgi:hypothetical protein